MKGFNLKSVVTKGNRASKEVVVEKDGVFYKIDSVVDNGDLLVITLGSELVPEVEEGVIEEPEDIDQSEDINESVDESSEEDDSTDESEEDKDEDTSEETSKED